MDGRYVYEPLAPGFIRLLYLQPGVEDEDIHFRLQHVSVDDATHYEAISYHWGDPAETKDVYCESKSLQITVSLFAAFKRLRLPDATRVLWADAVCINQADIAEKKEQVELMSTIYSRPTRVLIWLGDDTTGLEGLRECIAGAMEILPERSTDHEVLQANCRRIFHEAKKLRAEKKPNFYDHDWAPFNNLLCRPWFQRRWVIQEVVNAGEGVPRLALCGDMELSWTDLGNVGFRLAAHGITACIAGLSIVNHHAPSALSFFQDGGRPLHALHALYMTLLFTDYRAHINLLDCVQATPTFQCSDARDHLYALLSLSSKAPASLRPDYSLSITEVCRRFATAILVEDQNLRVLSLAPHTSISSAARPMDRAARLDLPSWVPDLAHQDLVNPLVSYTIRTQLFHAGGGGPAEAPVRVSEDGRFLHLRGRVVDSVKGLARCPVDVPFPSAEDVAPKTGFSAMAKMRMRNWLAECMDLAAGGDWAAKMAAAGGPDSDATAAEKLKTDFARAVMCDMTGMRDPVDGRVLAAVHEYTAYLTDYFDTPGFVLSEERRDALLTYAVLVEQSILAIAEARRFCTTAQGRMGQVRNEAVPGDLFCVISGAEVPYVVRPNTQVEGTYELIGDAFLVGVMQGETLQDERYETVDIVLA